MLHTITMTMTIDTAMTTHYQLLPHQLLTVELLLVYESLQHSYKQL